ncbi:MAG: VCBS repeat-containing protein [Ferruginibacter sp.]
MKRKYSYNIITLTSIGLLAFILNACNSKTAVKDPMFKVLDSKTTGLNFSNDLSYDTAFNLFKYMYFYNGSGVGAGDFNNDGLIDLFFGSNQHDNKLFINTGNLHFKEVTKEANIPENNGWTTGISVIDINNDGLLDIYVCQVGNYEILHSKNQLLINQGLNKDSIPVFKDEAAAYGLDFSGFSTQAAFFDYDNDGDLDMYLLNHSVHENGTFHPRKVFEGTHNDLSGDRIYRNDGNKFTDVSMQTGINTTAIGYGLGISIADINLDGYPDIYIGNDFHEDDYLYINQKNGTFKEENEKHLMHTSQFTMGVDVADINNDASLEIFSVDMLPSDPYILKRSLGEDTYDIFKFKIDAGYSYQYTRNNFQYNRRNGQFSEIGLYSGVGASDWSWAPLWVDFDNDGLKDLFISNGIPKRMNDIDYINFISNGAVQQMIRDNNLKGKDLALIDKFPEIKLPNKFYKNNGDLTFTDEAQKVEGSIPTFSNGAVYADLDNDGDLDIVVNNIDAQALVYENTNAQPGKIVSQQVILQGAPNNIHGTGSKVILFANSGIRTYDKFPVKGFLSSMEVPFTIGLENTKIDSAVLIWPDNTYQPLKFEQGKKSIKCTYQKGLPLFDYSILTSFRPNTTRPMEDITAPVNLKYLHQENHFSEFDREPLLPNMLSTESPALAVADINHDGLQDVFFGSSRDKTSAVFIQQATGAFTKFIEPALANDSIYEDVAACWTDINNDGNIDLVVACGGNEFYGNDAHNTPRIYLNDGKGNLSKQENSFDTLYLTASSIAANDFNGDGYMDLFIGARTVPWEYGQVPQSYLLMNDKTGHFKDVTSLWNKELAHIGFVTSAQWLDMDKDGDQDLLLSLEWGGIIAFIKDQNGFTRKDITNAKGWWNNVLPCDIDNDGDIDFIAGNLGLNSRLKTSPGQPVRMYFNDFDANGKKEQILTYYLENKEIPFANKMELEKQMPVLKKKYLYAEDFARASLQELFTSSYLDNSKILTADYFPNSVLINNGDGSFETKALPAEAQFSPFKDAVVVNANDDNLPDILLVGNFYDNNIEMGRYDADFGTLLINRGKGNFDAQSINGLQIKGQVRHISPITINNKQAFILARNNDSAMVIRFR